MNKLTSPQDAIKQATGAGWHPTYLALPHLHDIHCEAEILTDLLFWQALGKARGWGERLFNKPTWTALSQKDKELATNQESRRQGKRWFETRMSNGDETKFWESLP